MMICYCRLLHRVFSASSKNKRLTVYLLQPTIASPERYISVRNHQILPDEKSSISQAIIDLTRGERIWRKRRDSEHFNSFFNKCFSRHDSSYIVHLLRAACDSYCSPELLSGILTAFHKSSDVDHNEFSLSLEQKIDVLNCILNQRYIYILQFSCTVLKINEDSHILKNFIDGLLQDEKLFEAAFCIGALNLQKEYDIENIVLPLLTQGKTQAAFSCMSNCPESQLKIAQKLDSLLNIKNIEPRNLSSGNSKKIYKTLSSMVNAFKIPPEHCKNLCYIRGRAALNLLIKRRAEQSVSEGTWEEMVMSIVGDNQQLKEHLIYKLVMTKDIDTAVRMLSKLNMPDYDIAELASHLETSKISNCKEHDLEDMSDEKDEVVAGHFTFSLPSSDIRFIDTKEKFLDSISDITKNYNMIGIDTEWKPNFGLAQDRLALIQLAVHDKVYIIDMLSLNDCLETEIWDKFMDDIFGSSKIIKLGCGIMADVQMLVENNKGTKGKPLRFSHVLDMAVFYQKLQEVYPEHMEVTSDNSKNLLGLSKLCEIILGKPLNKEERLCDWEKRPLSESQLGYAALDAYCLLQMFDKLKQIAVKKDMNFEHLSKVAIVLTSKLWKPKWKLKGIKNEKGFQIQKPIPIQQFKVLLDSKLELLIKELRQLGADVAIFSESDSLETALLISKSERRIFICSEPIYKQVHQKIAHMLCYNAVTNEGDQISTSEIIQHFNVMIKTEDILPPCEVCNSEAGIRLSADDINFLQEHLTMNSNSVLKDNEITNSFQRIVREMIKSGLNIKFEPKDVFLSERTELYLCTKCGTVQ